MSRIATPAVGHMQNLARNPILIALFVGLSLAGCASKKGLPNDANGLGLNGAGNAAPGSPQDFTVNVGDRIFFDTDSSSIRADAGQTLDRQAQWLARYPNYSITVEGHADERGTREYNFALGARRAQAVMDFLVGKGVLPSRIATISYGKENPIDPGSGEDSWAKNRNAHTAITSGAQ